ncbi:cell wall-binding repeat-containing protein [Finegoldia magna]|uniref:cell wall-binding repeat-containing protein n=1 Tax=Finegoldia magna TaxID=1260 RepID=UPI001CE03538|nr:cell wall-binding repeat-containing protein [Finegoldia magna]MCA5587157.1 cell wall-binding repeat-containing protein [Finegoldia magna]
MRHSIRKEIKRFTCFCLTMIMVLTSMPVHLLAAGVDYNDLSNNKTEIVNNKLPVEVAKPEIGKTANDLIKNPDQPKIYTLRTDYKVPKNGENKINYQPYVASVGEKATDAEKAKVNKKINLPDLKGYVKPQNSYNINFQDIVDKAKNPEKDGFNFVGTQEFVYGKKQSSLKIVHKFQKLEDFNKYEENPNVKPTQQTGYTGSVLEVNPIRDSRIVGFEPEADVLPILVPEDTRNFEVEFRYNRKTYEVNFNTDGGSSIPTRLVYFEQTIPTVEQPTKVGSIFLGWKPSVDLKDANGNTFKANKLMKDSSGNAIMDLKANVKMPASNVTFTAVWEDEKQADYVIQFWTEKPDYDDKDGTLPLRDRYDFIGARRIDKAVTGSTPKLTDLDIHGIKFPDLNDERLEKAQDDKEEFERYYFLNAELTKKQNASKDNPEVQKSVLSTGETVYNVYYDRRVYTLYFTAPNEEAWDPSSSYWPTLTRNGQVIGKEGSPYKVEARFNQSLDKIWPKDEEISGLPPASSAPGVDMGPIGWTINVNEPGELIFRDTPPYRLSAEDFIDSQDVVGTGDYEGHGHGDQIPIGENQTKARGKYEISMAASSWDESVVHHIDIIKDDFNGKEQIDYDLSYWKSDTNATYSFLLPHLQGFTLKKETREAEWVFVNPKGRLDKSFDDLNKERAEKTPFRSDADKIEYIDKFPWGTKIFDGRNYYNYANYTRNKYKLKLNNDPKAVKNDGEYGAGNILDVPYEKPLKDLNLDTEHKPERPEWVPDDWTFRGWALDPAGENLVKDGNETKLHYDQTLFAKWTEPDKPWKITVDPNQGTIRDIEADELTKNKVTVDKDEKPTEYPIKENNEANKQVFTVNNMQQLKNLPNPTRKGYDFLGWEWVRYKEDGTVDDSYTKTYHVPEKYPFGNDVVSDVYLKAIWVENNRVDVEVYHHFIDKDGNEIKDAYNPKKQILHDIRANQYVSASAIYQDEDWTLMPHEELEKIQNEDIKEQYKEYNDRVKLNNTDMQIIRVEPEKILQNGNSVDNPKAKNNVFHFYYRHFRTRDYKVNYVDERGKAEIEAEKDSEKKKELIEKYSVIAQEQVQSKNRHYDARNYRPIPGWVLASEPQQQLFYDIDETTGEFKGINGTGSDEITFYYKDVRVIEVPENEKTPEGYVRVTFKADEGGSFGKDAEGKDIKILHYDVIKGIKSDLLQVPQQLEEGKEKESGKYYITPDAGRRFKEWDNQKLLNNNTIIDKGYTFTAYFEWSDVKIDTLVVTESNKEHNNNFAPTTDQLKGQVHWYKNNKEEPLPEGSEIIFDADIDNKIYEQVKELNKNDTTELVREIKVPAKIKFADNSVQEIDIPVKIYKNVYEALTSGEMPKVLKDATTAPNGDLVNVTGEYKKVTVNPSGKPNDKDSKIYYVNPKAWVEIPEIKLTDEEKAKLGFTNWSADKKAQNEDQTDNGIYNFNKRHMFTEDTVISPGFSKDVIPQTGTDKPKVPDNFVKVIVKSTDKAVTEFTKTFWVNPTKEVTIPVDNPVGKTVDKTETEQAKAYTFKDWKSNEETSRTWASEIKGQFTKETTITAEYTDVENIIPYNPEEPVTRPKDYVRVKFVAEDGLTLQNVKYYYVKKNSGVKLGNPTIVKPTVDEKTGYKFEKWDTEDTFEITETDITVTAKSSKLPTVIPEKDDKGDPNEKPKDYKEVTFVVKTEDAAKGTLEGVTKFYVNPTEYVTINPPTTKSNTGFEFGAWDKDSTIPTVYDKDTTITGSFNDLKDVVPKTKDDESEKPAGYKTVTFVIDPATGGKIAENEVTVYYVNPAKDVTVPQPKTQAETGYEFDKWDQDTVTKAKKYAEDTTVKGNFKKLDDIIPGTKDDGSENPKPDGYVTVTFVKGEHGTEITGQTVYYVNPNADPAKTLGDKLIVKPTVKPETGYKFTKWDFADTKEIRSDITVTAQYEELKDVIPKTKDDDSEKPAGYITVTFSAEKNGKLKGTSVYYVNPNKAVVLKDKAPSVTPNTGFEFAGWDTQIERAIQYNDNDVIKAEYNAKGDVIPQEKPDGTDKPEGYLTVTFDKGEHGKEITGKTVYYVKPNTEVTVPAPKVTPNTGWKQKDDEDAWDKALTQTFNEDTKITAQYAPIDNIIPGDKTKPDGYVTVTFVADENGRLTGTTVYYVNPNVEVNLTDKANAITKTPNVGYTAEGGSWINNDSKVIIDKFNKDTEFKFNFVKLDDVIPAGDKVEQPKGYVKVEFTSDDNGSLEGGNKTYYVNPTKGIKVGSDKLPIPQTKPNANYKFDKWLENIDQNEAITTDKKYVATFKINKVTMTYKADDKTSGTVPKELSYDVGTEITLAGGNDLKKDNFVLEGWKIGDTVYKPGATFTINENTTAQAVWNADTHTVEFNTDGGTHIPSQKVKHNELITKVNNPEKPNYTFIGWKVDGKDFDPATEKITKDITLVAQYVPDVIPQTGTEKPKDVPNNFVEVKFVPTDKATDSTPQIFWVNPDKEVTISVAKPNGKQHFTFKEWKIGEKADGDVYKPNTPKKFETATTITATYTEAENIIPYDPQEPITRPDGYVRVTFAADEGLTLQKVKFYYVKKNAGVTLKELAKPEYSENLGYKFKNWDKEDSLEITDKDVVVKAQSTPIADVIEGKPGVEKPDGYVEVKFVAGDNGTVEETTYFVNPSKYVTLMPPTTKPNTGFEFGGWSQNAEIPTQYTEKITTITANFNPVDSVIPKTEDDQQKPDGYVTVTFVIKGEGGQIAEGETITYFVNPNVEVTIPQPNTKAEIGYEFGAWDIDTTTKAKYETDTTVTGNFKKLDDIIPSTDENGNPNAKPEGYVTVTFDKGANGNLTGQTSYYVNPNANKTLEDLQKPTVKPETGFKFKAWDTKDDFAIKADKTVTAQYDKLADVIPKTKDDDSEKPAGYITVTFDTTEKGKIKDSTVTTKVVFVNPNVAVVLKGFAPEVVANKGYEFERWDTSIEKAIQYNDGDTIKAIYKDDKTPGTTPGTNPDKPDDKPNPDKPDDKPDDKPNPGKPDDKPDDKPNPGKPDDKPNPGKPDDKPGTVPENPGAIPGTTPGEVEKHGDRYVERVAGKDRSHTAISTSKRFFNKSKYVIIADSGNYPDALTATVLAHVLDCPILLNNTRYLEDDVAQEIVRLGATEVIIVGGHKSISENVKSQLAKYDQNKVQRIWGRDRYVTSSELAYEIERLTGKVNKAIIASGEDFPDALATAPLGSKEIAPILLVTRNQMDKKVDKALKDLNINKVYVAGGEHSVSKKLEAQLPQVIRRFNGQDRYETAILVASYTYPESKEVFVASGEVFPDALVIGPVCARRKAPILLSKSTPVKVTDDYIEKSKIEYLYIVGGVKTIHVDTAHKYAIED